MVAEFNWSWKQINWLGNGSVPCPSCLWWHGGQTNHASSCRSSPGSGQLTATDSSFFLARQQLMLSKRKKSVMASEFRGYWNGLHSLTDPSIWTPTAVEAVFHFFPGSHIAEFVRIEILLSPTLAGKLELSALSFMLPNSQAQANIRLSLNCVQEGLRTQQLPKNRFNGMETNN